MAAKNGSRIINRMITEFPMLSPDAASTFNALMTLYLQLGRLRKTALALFEVLGCVIVAVVGVGVRRRNHHIIITAGYIFN